MTIPLSGYPDWQGQSIWTSTLTNNETINLLAGGQFKALFGWSSSFASRILRFRVTAGRVRITLEHNRANPDADLLPSNIWVLTTGTELVVAVPELSNFMGLTIDSDVAAASTVILRAQQSNAHSDKIHYIGNQNFISGANPALAAAATDYFFPPFLLPGPAFLCFQNTTAGANLDVRLLTYNKDGTVFQTIYILIAPPLVTWQNLLLPSTGWQFQVTNNGAGATGYIFGITMSGDTN